MHFEDKILDQVRFGGFPTTCAILFECESILSEKIFEGVDFKIVSLP